MNNQVEKNELGSGQKQVAKVLDQLTKEYRLTKDERRVLAKRSNKAEDFTLLEELELLIGDIRGFGFQVADTGSVQDVAEAIASLKKLSVFNVPIIEQFYFDDSTEFESVKRHIIFLDYLRLLVLEHLQALSTEESVVAA